MKFHPGEQQVQARLGRREAADSLAGRAIRDYLPDQHRTMLGQLPFVIVASRGPQQRLWAGLLPGLPGFIQSPSKHELLIASQPLPGDALENGLASGGDIGVLAIALDTRRRNRINGVITTNRHSTIAIKVKQCFGNCPQYIHPRQWYLAEAHPVASHVSQAQSLNDAQIHWLRRANTFFIASGYSHSGDSNSGLDVSHRGGPTGFVQVINERQILFPDYPGNNFFNTLGNIVMDPQVGLLFVDFSEGNVLQLSGRAKINWHSNGSLAGDTYHCSVTVTIDELVCLMHALPLRWK